MEDIAVGLAEQLVGLRHVGIVTTSRSETVTRLCAVLGVPDSEVVRVPADDDRAADTWFGFIPVAGTTLEVIEPVSDRFRHVLLDSGTGCNHVCFTVKDLDEVVGRLRDSGIRLGHVTPDGIAEAPTFRLAYADPADTSGVLLEFIQDR